MFHLPFRTTVWQLALYLHACIQVKRFLREAWLCGKNESRPSLSTWTTILRRRHRQSCGPGIRSAAAAANLPAASSGTVRPAAASGASGLPAPQLLQPEHPRVSRVAPIAVVLREKGVDRNGPPGQEKHRSEEHTSELQ